MPENNSFWDRLRSLVDRQLTDLENTPAGDVDPKDIKTVAELIKMFGADDGSVKSIVKPYISDAELEKALGGSGSE